MQMLFLQTAALLLAAYFVGAFCGCLTRRVFFAGRAREEPQAETILVAEPPSPPESQRFADALKGPGTAPIPAEREQKPLPAPIVGQLPAAGGSSGQGSVAAMVARPAGDDLTQIRGIDVAMKDRLAGLGIMRFADIAAWRAADVQRVSASLGIKGRVAAENWIEQAQILAKGGVTKFVRDSQAALAIAAPTPDEGTAKPVAPLPVPRVEERAAFAEIVKGTGTSAASPTPAPLAVASATATAAAVAEAAAAVTRMAQVAAAERANAPGPRDDLKRIAGLDAAAEKVLNAKGIQQFAQIAAWGAADVAGFDRMLGGGGRIAAENWVEQAQILARGGETAFSRERERQADAVRPARALDPVRDDTGRSAAGAGDGRSDLAGMRSVRSEAYRGDAGPHRVDDLKRIRGIGLLIEKRLSGLGITTYEQIANWSESDIDRISQTLEFRGRIERENWVEQARILASGGQTEFSRRVDRGDPDAGRARAE